jgi:NhaP-type Na+/H+ or K+/H+ antiporter
MIAQITQKFYYLMLFVVSVLLCLCFQSGQSATTTDDTHEEEHGEHSQIEVLFSFFILAIFIGAATTYLISRWAPSLPYTVVVFVIGILIAAVTEIVDSEDSLQKSVALWDRTDPHIILYAFLPALLFGEAMSLSFHQMKESFFSSLLLAGPGAVFGTFGLAGVAYGLLPYHWTWHFCLVFGSILSATDPVGELP